MTLDGDAGLVFRSAHFAKYFTIRSVKFESLCIRPIMSTKADKGDRKREIEQSPMKKNSEIQPSPVKSWTVLLLAALN